MPYLAAFASFRENVRQIARSQKGKETYCLCYFFIYNWINTADRAMICIMLKLTYCNKLLQSFAHTVSIII